MCREGLLLKLLNTGTTFEFIDEVKHNVRLWRNEKSPPTNAVVPCCLFDLAFRIMTVILQDSLTIADLIWYSAGVKTGLHGETFKAGWEI